MAGGILLGSVELGIITAAKVVLGLICLKEHQRGPVGLSEPEEADFSGEVDRNEQTAETTSPEEARSVGRLSPLPCPGEIVYQLTAAFPLPQQNACQGLDFAPYAQEAEARASFWEFNCVTCRKGCSHRMEILRREGE